MPESDSIAPDAVIHNNIVEATFQTPLVRLNRIMPEGVEVLAKCEYFNPMSSVKDRIGRAMIEAGEANGDIGPGSTIIESTSGNTGIALAFVCASKGYKLILTMPDSMSEERRALLMALGAQVVLTPDEEGMRGAIEEAAKILATTPHAWMPQQFENPANPLVHEKTTGPEIYRDTQGKVDALVAGVGTGGTISGSGKFLKSKLPHFKCIAVEPTDSAVISGGRPGSHGIQGIGAGFIPQNLNVDIVDRVEQVCSDDAYTWARRLGAEEGILGGISSGAAICAAHRIASEPEYQGKRIVVIIPSCGERYLSTALFTDILQEVRKNPVREVR